MAFLASREVQSAASPEIPRLDPELLAVLRAIDAATPAEYRVAALSLDQLVRERTASKGYAPAPHWSLCTECAQPCSSTETLAIDPADGSVRHAVCR